MSTFAQRTLTCSACRQPSAMSVAVSLNGGRRPDLRLAILDDTFQRITCPSCGVPGRIEQPFVYLDFTRKHWITCFNHRREASWATLEGEPHEDWKEAMITFAPRIVREMSASFRIRAVFGVDALREKLLCFEHGIDDVWLAVLQLDAMRSVAGLAFSPARRLRLSHVDPDTLHFRVMGDGAEWSVPRARLVEMQMAALEWSAAHEILGRGPYVDVGRLMIGRR